MLATLFNEILYRPILNALVFIYNNIPDFGIAIILLTILIRFVLYPLSYKSIKSRKELSKLQPKIKEVQKKFKEKEEQTKELMKVYKEHNINPLSGCLPILIQLPILIALYRVLINVLEPGSLELLYPFVSSPGSINPSFLGLMDLSAPSAVLAILAGVSQFFYSKIMMKHSPSPQPGNQKGMQQVMSKQMVYIMPVITVFIAWNFPAGLPLYWIVSTVIGFLQENYLFKKNGKDQKKN
ncbi:MAG: membrane protein insertase YidC [Candidatus Portnoybacteria bacterium]|nr:membrane protein insertase YidC [Candidatus Portnoybacteria bacterium]